MLRSQPPSTALSGSTYAGTQAGSSPHIPMSLGVCPEWDLWLPHCYAAEGPACCRPPPQHVTAHGCPCLKSRKHHGFFSVKLEAPDHSTPSFPFFLSGSFSLELSFLGNICVNLLVGGPRLETPSAQSSVALHRGGLLPCLGEISG